MQLINIETPHSWHLIGLSLLLLKEGWTNSGKKDKPDDHAYVDPVSANFLSVVSFYSCVIAP